MQIIDFDTIAHGAVASKIGGRSENQDHFAFAATPVGYLIVVCDGMGGGPGGQTASTLATDTIVASVKAAAADASKPDTLIKAVTAANKELRDTIITHPHLKGMGTTCVCVLITGKDAFIAHVGDSRCYVLRKGKIAFRTADHSQVGNLVAEGKITEEQARISPYSNIITRAIGIADNVETEIDHVTLRDGDRIALMTDGIWGTMPQQTLVAELSISTADKIVATLPDRIDANGKNKGGGHDNLTLAAVDITLPKAGLFSKRKSDKATHAEDNSASLADSNSTEKKQGTDYSFFRSPSFIAASITILIIGAVVAFLTVGEKSPENTAPGSVTSLEAQIPQSTTENNNYGQTETTTVPETQSDDPSAPETETETPSGQIDNLAPNMGSEINDIKKLQAQKNKGLLEQKEIALSTLISLKKNIVAPKEEKGSKNSQKGKKDKKKKTTKVTENQKKEACKIIAQRIKKVQDALSVLALSENKEVADKASAAITLLSKQIFKVDDIDNNGYIKKENQGNKLDPCIKAIENITIN